MSFVTLSSTSEGNMQLGPTLFTNQMSEHYRQQSRFSDLAYIDLQFEGNIFGGIEGNHQIQS